MRITSYFSGTVEAALGRASRELGDDVLLLDVREARPGLEHLGRYEVVLGVSPGASADRPDIESGSEPGDLRDFLIAQDVPTGMATRLCESFGEDSVTEEDLREALAAGLRAGAPRRLRPGETLAFAGPPGAGKTTALLKVAYEASLTGCPVAVLDTCSRRPGAAAVLEAYTRLLGCEYRFVADPARLRDHAVSRDRLTLIDTPGFAPAEAAAQAEWAAALEGIPEAETHLTLSATARSADLWLAWERYRMFPLRRMTFTRLDEATAWGGIWSLAVRTGLAVAWLCAGPDPAEGFEAASAERIAAGVLAPVARQERALAAGARA